jgi:hypothetical protein
MPAYLVLVLWYVHCYKKGNIMTPDSQFFTGTVGFSMWKLIGTLGTGKLY